MVEPLCQDQLSVQQLQLYQLCLLTINYYQCSQGVYAGNVAVPPVLRTCFAAMLLGCLCSAGFRSSWWGMWWCWELGCLWVWFCVPYFKSFSKKKLHFQYKVWACCCALPGRLFHLGAGFVGVVWGLLGAWALWSCVCTGTGSSEYCQSLCHVSP